MVKGTPVNIGGKQFSNKGEARSFIDEIRKSYDPGDDLSLEDTAFLLEAIKSHPEYITKFTSPIESFFVGRADFNTIALHAQMTNGDSVKFSARGLVPTTPRKVRNI